MAAAITIKKNTKAFAKKSTVGMSKRLSKVSQFWEKYPNGVVTILDHKAILK